MKLKDYSRNDRETIEKVRAEHGGWPKEAYFGDSQSILVIGHDEANENDLLRCGPVFLIDGDWAWCNRGFGGQGHINNAGQNDGPYCSYCKREKL
jgi:hypothetical protein